MTELLVEPSLQSLQKQGIFVDSVTKTYRGGKVRALSNLSLEIKPGEAFGLVGPNGAGKTTFLSCLMGFLKIDAGQILIDGRAPDDLATRRLVGYLPERLTFDRWMSGRDYLNYHHELAAMPATVRMADCERLLTRVELDPAAWLKPVRKYSRGMLQRLGFAQALIGAPRYLFLDEPASGMDPVGVMVVRDLLRQLKQEGMTIVLNSHQLDQIEHTCDRVAFLKDGTVVKIEDMRAAAVGDEYHTIRWLTDGGLDLGRDKLSKIVKSMELSMLDFENGQAKIVTNGGAQTALLVKALVLDGFPIVEVRQEDGRLERLFKRESPHHASAGNDGRSKK
jgi:ABC-2 type transport system ATP-binding protein